ncbi:MAG: hypothetical protein VX785_07005, partial [Actinomycetota bacterium]|nr:hypothetical protein [Actinomycetota bacterium]
KEKPREEEISGKEKPREEEISGKEKPREEEISGKEKPREEDFRKGPLQPSMVNETTRGSLGGTGSLYPTC